LLYRYATSADQRLVRKAKIYTSKEHGIILNAIDPDAVHVVRKLVSNGHKAYIVGGAVRDLLLGKRPKDFDIATDARPQKIRRLFRRSRIVGRRFKLVHVYYGRGKTIEVSTFRSSMVQSKNNNIYGTLGEDAFRRDFSLNALFYSPQKEQIIDYVEGITDIRKRKVRVLGPVKTSFLEDPVRMIRAVKYASVLDFSLPFTAQLTIKRRRNSMINCSPERLTEEMYKILESGNSHSILQRAYRLRLLEVLLPSVTPLLRRYQKQLDSSPLFKRLGEMDRLIRDRNPKLQRGEALSCLFFDLVGIHPEWAREPLTSIQQSLRIPMKPLVPSNKDLLIVSRIVKLSAKQLSLKQESGIDQQSWLQLLQNSRNKPKGRNIEKAGTSPKSSNPDRRNRSRRHRRARSKQSPSPRSDSPQSRARNTS